MKKIVGIVLSAFICSLLLAQSSIQGGKFSSSGKTTSSAAWTAGNNTGSVDNFWVAGNLISNDLQGACWFPAQATVSNGTLILTDVYSSGGTACYSIPSGTSPTFHYYAAALYRPKSFLYGTFEVKMQMASVGSNSAFWLLTTNCYPDPLRNFASNTTCGWSGVPTGDQEIDVVEYGLPSDSGTTAQNLASAANGWVQYFPATPDATTVPHLYSVYWTSSSVTFYIDGASTGTYTTWPLNLPMYMWLTNNVYAAAPPSPGEFPTQAIVWSVKHWNGTSGFKSGTLDCSYVPGGPSSC